MRHLIFTAANGRSVKLDSLGLFLLTSLSGLGDIPVLSDTRKAPFQDGETWVASVFGTRNVVIEGVINTRRESAVYNARRALAAVLNPKLGPGILTVYLGSSKVYVLRNARASLPQFPEQDIGQRFLFVITGDDPYLYASTYSLQELGGWEGGLSFPFTFPVNFMVRANTAELILQNEGDVETPIEAWFHGPLTQAKLTNETTGEFILIERALLGTEELYVNTMQGELDVKIINLNTNVETDGWGYIGEDNTFWRLQPGANLVSYDPAGGGTGTAVRVRYRSRYVGV